MLLPRRTLARIETGEVTPAFRHWRRPSVKAGGTLLTDIGQLAIDAVEPAQEEEITDADAVAAGAADRGELLAQLAKGSGRVYRIVLRLAGPDPRIALRSQIPDDAERCSPRWKATADEFRWRRGGVTWRRAGIESPRARPSGEIPRRGPW